MKQQLDITGHEYGKLKVIRKIIDINGLEKWECVCECGGVILARKNNLRRGHSNSCGCVGRRKTIQRNKENAIHGISKYPALKQMFKTMHKNNTVDSKWARTIPGGESFISWIMNNGWKPNNKYKLKLKDSNSPIGPDNCELVLHTPNLIGTIFNELTVISQAASWRGKIWNCLCSCGNTTTASTRQLQIGGKKSCGCRKSKATIKRNKDNATHGLRTHALYRIRRGIINRCADKTNKYYGAKGITVCDEWKHSVVAFFEWAILNGWKMGLSIHRKDPTGNYTPDNCVFMTKSAHTTLHNHWKYNETRS